MSGVLSALVIADLANEFTSAIAHGDLYVSGDQRVVEHYLAVFKKFHDLGHYSAI